MNTRRMMRRDRKKGGALVMALLMTTIASIVAASYAAYSSQSAAATMRMIDYQKAKIAAEAGLEYGVRQLRDFILSFQFNLPHHQVQGVLSQMQPPPSVGGYEFRTPRNMTAFEVTANTLVTSGVITNGAACLGSEGEFQVFTITAGARNPNTGVGAVLQQELQGVGLFLIRYAVFYEKDLEMNPGPSMTLSGPVHCNADIYMAPDSGPLYCYDRLTCVGDIHRHRKDSSGTIGHVYVNNASGMSVPMTTDSDNPDWMLYAIQTWNGRVLTRAHGVQHLAPPIAPVDVPHDIIERPLDPTSSNYQAQTESEKFANKAAATFYVGSNGVLTVKDCFGTDLTPRFTNAVLKPSGSSYGGRPLYSKNADNRYLFLTSGAYDVSQTFYDGREKAVMAPLDLYIDELTNCFPQLWSTNYSIQNGWGVLYVTRDDPDGAGAGVQPCVRIRNGAKLPFGGLTIASDLPIYLEGSFNTNNPQPALLAGDAVTFLSDRWQDARSWGAIGDRSAFASKYYVVVMTGNTETQWGKYNGGLENVIRFLENWTGKTCFYRGAIIDLWYSEVATGQWSYGSYYTAPQRDWGYDAMYRSKAPPGMTRVFGLEEITWRESSWAEVGWN